MQQTKLVQALVSIGLVGLLAACGGGGDSSSASTAPVTPPVATKGTVNMAITDGPSDTYNHVWVTITGIAFHTDPNASWSASDATWQTSTLSTPQTIDLAQLNNGALNNLFNGMTFAPGTYKQIRFFFLGDEQPLSSSAQALSNNASPSIPLQWNDQVEYLNASGTVSEAPLEIANPVQGVRLDGNFVVSAGSTLNLATDFDLDKIVVPFKHGGMNSFTLKPDLRYFNMANSGAVTGQVAVANLCPTSNGIITSQPAANCAFNLIVHAETVTADGTRYEDVRSTSVNQTTGAFTLAPLPMTDINGNKLTYDIIVRGRQMQTLAITGVQPSGTYTFASGAEGLSGGTALSATPLPVTVVNEYPSNFATQLQPLTSGEAVFEQTFANGTNTLPHEIRWADTNPYTGTIDRTFMAPWNQAFYVVNAGLNVAPYSATGLTFAAVTPLEGNGNYNVIVNEHVYYDFGAAYNVPNVAANLLTNLGSVYPAANSTVTSPFSYNAPVLAANVQSGTINGTVGGTLSPKSNGATVTAADVVLARDAAIISTTPINFLSPGCNATTMLNNCTYSFSGVGSGSTATELSGAYYYVYVRVTYSDGTHKTVPVNGYGDLRKSVTTPALNVTLAI